MFGEPECCADFVEADCDCGSPEFILLAQRREEFDEHRLLCGDRDLFRDDLGCVALVAVPSFLLSVSIVAGLGFSVLQPEAGMVPDLVACDAELLAVIFQHLPATCDHTVHIRWVYSSSVL
jgi:hypothetical protein